MSTIEPGSRTECDTVHALCVACQHGSHMGYFVGSGSRQPPRGALNTEGQVVGHLLRWGACCCSRRCAGVRWDGLRQAGAMASYLLQSAGASRACAGAPAAPVVAGQPRCRTALESASGQEQHMTVLPCFLQDCAREYGITRAEQDAHAIQSYERAQRAALDGLSGKVS